MGNASSTAREIADHVFEKLKYLYDLAEDYVRRHPRRVKRAVAVSSSLFVHLLFFLAVIITATGKMVASNVGEGDDNAITVTLGSSGSASAAPAAEDAMTIEDAQLILDFDPNEYLDPAALDPFPQAEMETSGDGTSDSTGPFDFLMDGDAETFPSEDLADGQDESGTVASKEDQGAGQAGLDSAQIWAQVEQCWRRPPAGREVAVTIEVTIGPDGFVLGQPRIVRPLFAWGSVNRDIAEARAVRAIAACAPIRLPGGGREPQHYTLDFNP